MFKRIDVSSSLVFFFLKFILLADRNNLIKVHTIYKNCVYEQKTKNVKYI